MKNSIYALVATVILTLSANAQQIVIDGQQREYRESLSSSVSRTEYRTEYRETTCSREVIDGYEQECRWEPGETYCTDVGGGQTCGITPENGRVCHDLPSRRECHTSPGRNECYNRARYRTEYYSCTKSVQVPYQVRLYDVQNDVTIQVERNKALPKGVQEVISLSQSGESFSLNAVRTTGKVLISATQSVVEVSNNGSLKRLKTSISVRLIDRLAAVGPFIGGVSELTGDINTLEITTGRITDLSAITIEIEARRNRLLGSDPVVIQKVLTLDDMQLIPQGDRTLIRIDFNKLGGPDKLSGKRAKIDVRIRTGAALESIINRNDLPAETEVSRRLNANF